MNTGQTVYEQLQEIQEAILKKVNYQEYKLYHDFIDKGNKSIVADNRYKISLNKPISLARVLSALGHGYWYDYSNGMIMFMKEYRIDGIDRKLTNEDGCDAMLSDQSP